MKRFASLRVRLVGIVFLAVAPALVLLIHNGLPWLGFVIGLVALAAAWFGGELFVLRKINSLVIATEGLASGRLNTRTGLGTESTELGDLARSFDRMAEILEAQIMERERTEKELLNRAHQQTVIAALGQFAMEATDLSPLLNQAVLLIAQTLDVEYCHILELLPDGNEFQVRGATGWKGNSAGEDRVEAAPYSQFVYTLQSGEPVVVSDLREETRFSPPSLLVEHGVISGVTVAILGHSRPFGVLGVHTTHQRTFSEDEAHFLLAVATVLSLAVARQQTEPEIQKLAAFAKFNPNPVLEFSAEGNLGYFNGAAQKIANLLGEAHPLTILPPDVSDIVQNCLFTGQNRLRVETRPGNRILSWSFYPIMASHVVHCYVEDITDRMNLEEQFRQAQKMDSVGQMAAGVAHDFNNVLTIIQGHTGLLMSRASLSPAMTTSIQAISFASERAVSLTRQLLMFSRKQVMQTKQIDLKEVVSNMSKMLQRLLGETIVLKCQASQDLPGILGDAGMMEQVLMNLAVNARDAMPKGGELTIQTDPIQIDEKYVQRHPDARAGLFVCLQVTDTGSGMDAATLKRIFEPFFTTKAVGKGTGLGLATVYAITKQHAGWIEVTSQPRKGTCFRIFVPASLTPAEAPAETSPSLARQVRGGSETILVVEDEPVLRDLARLILQDCGYRVAEAASGVEALTVWQRNQGKIDLLLTDMIMPDGLSGKDLAESLLIQKPRLKVIFTSGYNVEEFGADPSFRTGSRFLQKPYSRSTLAHAVRDCLDA
jgi:signal transduction histidine kinase/CheY-like chemotaxis protein/HAMP domain-containing protein